MTNLKSTQIAELKNLITDYRAECEALTAHTQADSSYDSIDEFLNYSDKASKALIAKMQELNLPLTTSSLEHLEQYIQSM